MQKSNTNRFVIDGVPVDFPSPAGGTTIKSAAKRFEAAWSIPQEAAYALACVIVDPAGARQAIDPNKPYEHLQEIQTPDGKLLLALRTQVWTALVSGDGGNGRSRFDIQTTNGNGTRIRPWPIGQHHKPAIIDYHPAELTDMAAAVRLSAVNIRSQDLITQIATNPRGVWNPPVVVLAHAYVERPDGNVDERWFTQTIEGSTRIEACHELSGTNPAAPLMKSDRPLEHLREWHGELVQIFDTTPTAAKTVAASRSATMPALIVVAAVEADGITPITDGFPAVVNDYVESVHVQPRPFTDIAQNNVIGERFILKLQHLGCISLEDAEAILGRSQLVYGKPSVRVAKLIYSACDPDNDEVIRDFVITAAGQNLTKLKRANLIGPLVVRQFDNAASTASSALMKAFTPDRLIDEEWTIVGDGSESLRTRCLSDYDNGELASAAVAELMARGGPALCAAGLLLSDQGSTVESNKELRGSVEKVVSALVDTRGGINVLADAVAWADGEQLERPRRFDAEGNPMLDPNGDQWHFSPEWRKGNMLIRDLAFNKGKKPSPSPLPGRGKTPQRSPEETFTMMEDDLLEILGRAHTILLDMYAVTDAQGRRLIATQGLRNAPIYEDLPKKLTRLHAKFGNSDEEFFDEDELPDYEPEPERYDSEYGEEE